MDKNFLKKLGDALQAVQDIEGYEDLCDEVVDQEVAKLDDAELMGEVFQAVAAVQDNLSNALYPWVAEIRKRALPHLKPLLERLAPGGVVNGINSRRNEVGRQTMKDLRPKLKLIIRHDKGEHYVEPNKDELEESIKQIMDAIPGAEATIFGYIYISVTIEVSDYLKWLEAKEAESAE